MRLIDADALIDEAIERYCENCDKRKGIKNGKWKIVYQIGDAPCRACAVDDMKCDIEDAPTIEPERKKGKWTTEEVAELLFNLFGEECACNFSGIDEWLPERCKYTESTCPDPPEKHGCWMQFLLQGGADMRQEGERNDKVRS